MTNFIKFLYFYFLYFIKFKTLKRIKVLQNKDFICLPTSKGIYKVTRRCPHQGAYLEQGYVNDDIIICRWHGSKICASKLGEKV